MYTVAKLTRTQKGLAFLLCLNWKQNIQLIQKTSEFGRNITYGDSETELFCNTRGSRKIPFLRRKLLEDSAGSLKVRRMTVDQIRNINLTSQKSEHNLPQHRKNGSEKQKMQPAIVDYIFYPRDFDCLNSSQTLRHQTVHERFFKFDGAVRIEYHGENVRTLYLARKVSPSIQSFVVKTFTNFPATI